MESDEAPQHGAWIRTLPPGEAEGPLLEALRAQASLYPPEYAVPVEQSGPDGDRAAVSIVMSHSLIPGALLHAFSTYGTLLSPELPLTRRQHELIAATVSAVNRCHY